MVAHSNSVGQSRASAKLYSIKYPAAAAIKSILYELGTTVFIFTEYAGVSKMKNRDIK